MLTSASRNARTALDGASSACAQCVVEKSGYTGMQCEKVGERGYPQPFNTAKASTSVHEGGKCCPSSYSGSQSNLHSGRRGVHGLQARKHQRGHVRVRLRQL